MQYNGEFKLIDSLEKAYLLGLIIADGSNIYNKQSGGYSTTIKLKKSDEYLLDKIVSIFPFFKKGKTETSKKGFKSEYIRKYDKNLFNDLLNHGVFPRKSFENASKIFLPKLNKELFFAYLHGICDGDGTIYQSKEGWIRIDLIGKTNNLFLEIQNKLKTFDIESTVYYREKRNYYLLRISNKKDIKKIIENFSKTPFCLKRKFSPYFNADWDRIPGYDNKNTNYIPWFATTGNH